MKKTVWKYGLIAGAFVTTTMLIGMSTINLEHTDMTTSAILGFGGMIVAFSLIILAIRSVRNNEGNGSISFKNAFLIGLYISLIASTMYATGWMVYYSAGNGSVFTETYTEASVKAINESTKSDEEKAESIAQVKSDMKEYDENALYRMAYTYIEILPLGLLLSLIFAAVMRKEVKPEGNS